MDDKKRKNGELPYQKFMGFIAHLCEKSKIES